MQPYKTTSDFGTSYYEIQKSKFYTYTAHVENEAAAREFVQGIKKGAVSKPKVFISQVFT